MKRTYWRPPPGRSRVRLVPFLDGNGLRHMFVTIASHWRGDPQNENRPVKCIGTECPICALREELSEETWKKISPRRQFLFCGVVRGLGDDGEDKFAICQFGTKIKEEILSFSEGEERIKNIFHPTKGRDFVIKRTGERLTTKYLCRPMPDPSEIGMEVDPPNLFDKRGRDPDDETLENLVSIIRANDEED